MNGRFVLCVKEEARNLKGEYGKSSNPPPDEGTIVVVIVWQLDLQLPMQSVPITTNIVSSNPAQARCTRYNIM
jgi:hypothetical protein